MTKVLAVISFIDQHGRPVDPGFGGGLGGGVDPDYGFGEGLHPSHGLPGAPGHPSNRPPGSYPGRPDNSLPGGGRPDNSLPWAPALPGHDLPGQGVGVWPPSPTDPSWGVGAPKPPGPGFIGGPRVDNDLPPVGEHKPVVPVPPGTIWPPLPAGAPEGKAAILVWISGVGWRFAVVTIPPPEVNVPKPEPK